MKLRSLILTIMLTGFAGSISAVFAQAPESFVYQGEARDKTGMVLANQDLSIRATLVTGASLTGSSTVWTKDYTVRTDDYGLFTLEVGDAPGEVAFAAINWGIGKYFLNIRVLSGNGWLDMGTTQLLSVPYALYAKSAGSVKATETDPIFIASASAGISWNHLENWNLAYSWGDHSAQGYLKGFTETDPFYKASPSSGITGTQIANWNLAYGWGDHSAQGYLKSFAETDPFYRGTPSAGITGTHISNWNAAYGWGNHASAGYLKSYTETDPIFAASPSNSITTTNIGNWNLAYGWGNHASAGYLKSYTETDPIFVASPSNGITTTNIGNWNLAYGWGNHASAGYLTSYTETDPIFVASPSNGITTTNIGNWNLAYGWGNHASAGYLKSYTETDPIFVASPSNGITTTNIGNWNLAYGWGNHASAGYLKSYTETDPIFLASPSNGITTTNIGNWNLAYGWGNHASAGYLTSYTETDPIFAASPSKNITTTFMANWDSAYSWGDHAGLYRGATWVPSWSEVSGKPFRIDDSPLNGDLLWWDGGIGRFINWTPNFLTAETDPEYLADFDLTGAAEGDMLKSDGSKFVVYVPEFTQSSYVYNSKYGSKIQAHNHSQTNVDVVLSPKGTGAVLTQQPDGTTAGGNNRGVNSVDLQTIRNDAAQVAGGSYSVISGGARNKSIGYGSFQGGGADNNASGDFSVISGGRYNSASGGLSVVGGGNTNTASSQLSFIGSGYSNTTSGNNAFVGGGEYNEASGYYSFIGAGNQNKAPSYGETVFGYYSTEYTPGTDGATQANETDRLFTIGNGTITSKRNAVTILKNANTTIGGTLTINANATNASILFPAVRGTSGQFLKTDGAGQTSWSGVTQSDVGLGNVENTALSTWTGSANITTLGTVATGTWSGTAIAVTKGGTGATTKAAGFDALSPMTTAGDIIYGGTSGTGTRLGKGTAGQVLTMNSGATAPQWSTPTNGTVTGVTGTAPIASTGGTAPVISISAATTSAAGSMSAADKTKLDGIEDNANNYTHPATDGSLHVPATSTTNNGKVLTAGATAGSLSWTTIPVSSVAGKTGTVTLAKADVGLGNVENTTLSTWTGSANITTLGTVATGTWSGTTIALNKGGTGATTKTEAFDALSPMTTAGDIIYGGTSGTGSRLAKGTAGQVLTMNPGATAPQWSTPASGTVTGVTGTAPIASTGGTAPVISISAATTSDAGSMSAADKTKLDGMTHAIGDSYGGGIVFYVYDGGRHGLIAATADQNTGIRWYGGESVNTRARADGIGAGLKNTAISIALQSAFDGASFAATVCNEYSVTADGVVYGDWYLPSKHELNLLYQQQATVGGFIASFYWSSTEAGGSSMMSPGNKNTKALKAAPPDYHSAWMQDFSNGSQAAITKSSTYRVRAIRAF